MKLRDTYDKDTCETVNVRITDVLFGTHKLSVLFEGNEEDYGAEFPALECFRDLMVLLGVQEFSEIEDSFVRVLILGPGLVGLANIVTDRTMIFSDYERHGECVEPVDEPKVEEPTTPKEDETHPPSRKGRPVGPADVYNPRWHEIIGSGGTRVEAHERACEAVLAMPKPKAPPFEATSTGKIEPPTAIAELTAIYNKAYAKAHPGESIVARHERACRAVSDHREIFTMASIEPPPGLPWFVKRSGDGGNQCLLPGGSGIPLAQYLKPELVDWLVNKAKIATKS